MRHLVHILEAATGGTRRHLWHLATGLDPARFRQTLIVSALRDVSFRDDIAAYRARGLAVLEVPMTRSPSLRRDPAAALQIAALLRQLAPDVVHTHSSKAGLLGRWAATRAGVPLRIHSPHVFAFEMRVAPGLRALFLLAERLAARWTDLLVCVSEAEARSARRMGRACPPLQVVHNGVDAPPLCPAVPLEARPLRALLPGRPCRQKGQDTLAEALLRHPELARHFQIELPGSDPAAQLPGRLRGAARAGLCRLLPACPPEAMPRRLESAAVVLLPSRWEGMPYTLLEAMAAARCVIAAAVGGVPEALVDGRNGLTVPPDDPEALAAALFRVASAPEQARAWGLAARETVLRKFRRDAMLQALSELYEGART